MKIGKPKYEQSTKNYFSFKKDQNTFILRILPPMGKLADAGKWSVYHRVEFGYKGTDGRMKPFLSPRKVNYNGMVEIESEAHKKRELIKQQMESAKQAGNKEVETKCKDLLGVFNQDAKHYMNVVDLQGNVGLFKIGHKGFQALKIIIDKLRGEGIDPVGIDNGRFFVFSRSGRGRETLYTVNEYKQKQEMIGADGNKIVVDAPFAHALTESIISKLETDAFELEEVYPTVTPEQEYRIVHEGPVAVDDILGNKKASPKTNPASTATTTAPAPAAEVATTTAPAPAAVETANTQTGEITQEPIATATPETTLAQTVEETPVSATTQEATTDLSNVSDEDFFKMVENGNF